MAGLFLLLTLCVVMALASFLAGALPLSMSLSQSQLRLLSSIGVGILVGTSLIVIIPEGIEAAASPSEGGHVMKVRNLIRRSPLQYSADVPLIRANAPSVLSARKVKAMTTADIDDLLSQYPKPESQIRVLVERDESSKEEEETPQESSDTHEHDHGVPTLEIGVSLIFGFVLMFLVDRLPRHATESLHSPPPTQHMSLEDLGGADTTSLDGQEDGLLGSFTPTPRKARSLATTTGLVIHAAADGIAMGATSSASDLKLGMIIFLAILVHKAPAAFGLTSVLLKQGLSKRAARGHLIVFSLAAPVGALTTWILISLLGGDHLEGESKHWWTGMLLLFSGGTFLYVAMQTMQEDSSGHVHEFHSSGMNGYVEGGLGNQRKAKGPQIRDTVATMIGMLLPILAQLGHSH